MGQSTPLFGVNFGSRSIGLPDQLRKVINGQIMDLVPDRVRRVANGQIMDLVPAQVRQVAAWNHEAVRTVFSVGFELMHCHHRGHHHDLIRCLANWIYHLKPPLDFLPDPIKKVANGRIMDLVPAQVRQVAAWNHEAVRTVFSVGFELMHCPHRGHHHDLIRCLANWIYNLKPPLDFLPDPIKKVANGQILDLLPGQLKQVVKWNHEAVRTVFSVGFELMHCKHRGHHHDLIRCLGNWIMHLKPPLNFMPDPIKKIASGQILDLVPDPVRRVASGQILDLLPDPVRKVAGGDVMGLMPDPVRKVAGGDVMGLMPDPVKKVASGNILDLMNDPVKKLASGLAWLAFDRSRITTSNS